MKLLQNRLFEGFFKNAGGMVRPSSKEELLNEIKIRLDRRQYNLNDIDTSKITDMNSLFIQFSLYDLSKIDISLWDTHNVESMREMFHGCTNFNSDLSRWDTSNVLDMGYMFRDCYKFNSDLSKWNTGKVTSMYSMFDGCEKFKSDLSKWDVSSVVTMNNMFYGCTSFNCDLSKWDVSNVQYMNGMFTLSGVKERPDWYDEWYVWK